MTTYILTITAAAMVVSILVALAGRGSMSVPVKLLAGIFMAITVVSPLLRLDLPDPKTWIASFETDGQEAAAAGKTLADDAIRTIIKERTQAYILDKAARYGASLEIDVSLDSENMPQAVVLRGSLPPYAKAVLIRELTAELGLGEEALHWDSSYPANG